MKGVKEGIIRLIKALFAISWSPGKELAGVLTVPPTAGVGALQYHQYH